MIYATQEGHGSAAHSTAGRTPARLMLSRQACWLPPPAPSCACQNRAFTCSMSEQAQPSCTPRCCCGSQGPLGGGRGGAAASMLLLASRPLKQQVWLSAPVATCTDAAGCQCRPRTAWAIHTSAFRRARSIQTCTGPPPFHPLAAAADDDAAGNTRLVGIPPAALAAAAAAAAVKALIPVPVHHCRRRPVWICGQLSG